MQITQSNIFLQTLVKYVQSGRLVPAAFQRPYRWTEEDVMALFDSILLRYPIGAFLFWSPYGQADLTKVGRGRLGPIVSAPDPLRSSLLLDGQNRLASMAWLMRDPAEPLPDNMSEQELATWGTGKRVVLDLEQERILFVPENEADKGFRMPAQAVFDSRVANRQVRARWDRQWGGYSSDFKNSKMKWLDDSIDAFGFAKVVVTDLENATVEEARDAFRHICKVGVPMSVEDLEASLAWAFPPGTIGDIA